jgi:hypothetical protein
MAGADETGTAHQARDALAAMSLAQRTQGGVNAWCPIGLS